MQNPFLNYDVVDTPTVEVNPHKQNLGAVFNDLFIPTTATSFVDTPTIKEEKKVEQITGAERAPDIKPVYEQERTKTAKIGLTKPGIATGKRSADFNTAFDAVVARNPEAAQYRDLLTRLAQAESGFQPGIKNPGAPAYGYFQFMEGTKGSKSWDNISRFSGLSIEEFKNNKEAQIEAAIKLAKSFEAGLSKEDLSRAEELGLTRNALIAGAWLGGNGGVRAFLQKGEDRSDKHHSKDGKTGTTVATRMREFNF